MTTPNPWRTDPYRLLFPIGYGFLVFGLGVWSVDLLGTLAHKETLHALLLGNGFLFAFALGILLSEAPRASGSQPIGIPLLGFFVISLLVMGFGALTGRFAVAYAAHLVSSLGLSILLGSKLGRPGMRLRPGIAIAFAAALFSVLWTGMGLLSETGAISRVLGRQAALEGFQGFFILFSMACLRWTWDNRLRTDPPWFLPAVFLLLASFAIEFSAVYAPRQESWIRAAYGLRAIWFLAYLRIAPGFGSLFEGQPLYTVFIRGGIAFMLAGSVLAAALPGQSLAYSHITFLAGFAWIAMAAATGVIVRRLQPGKRRLGGALLASAGLALALSAGLRTIAVHKGYPWLLAVGAAVALLPLLAWAIALFPILGEGKPAAPSRS